MKIKSPRLALATAVLTVLAAFGSAQAADVVPVFFDAAGAGYFDTTPVAPVGGNPGTTRGEQRRIAAQYAAALWGSVLESNVPIFIGARFAPLAPGVLGSAGSARAFADIPNGKPGVLYGGALADALVGVDLRPGFVDINSNFSTNFNFYYGLDGNAPAGLTNFLDVVMHEYAHGLGFASFANSATGALLFGLPDAYNVFAYHNPTAKFWPQMTDAERQTAVLDYGNVVFTGARATAGAQLLLGPRRDFRVLSPAPVAGNYSYGPAFFGPAITNANFTGEVVLGNDATIEPAIGTGLPGTATDGCSPLTNPANMAGKIVLLDRGYCGFTVKVKNAQNAGAKAVIIGHRVLPTDVPLADTNPPGGLGGSDPTITIPSLRVTQAASTVFKANLPLQVTFVVDPTKRQGADDAGRPRLFAPNPVQSGSSFSHYDSIAEPNLLMEPAINVTLKGIYDLDITPALLADIGWKLNTAKAPLSSPNVPACDAWIPVNSDSGLMAGATVQAAHQLCLVTARTRTQYSTCMTQAKDRLVASGLITPTQGQQVMVCARRVTDHTRFPIPQ